MLRPLVLAALLVFPALTATADTHDDQLLALVSSELPSYAPGVDATQLSRSQLTAIYSILHSGNSGGDKNLMIRSVLGGRLALRSLFSR